MTSFILNLIALSIGVWWWLVFTLVRACVLTSDLWFQIRWIGHLQSPPGSSEYTRNPCHDSHVQHSWVPASKGLEAFCSAFLNGTLEAGRFKINHHLAASMVALSIDCSLWNDDDQFEWLKTKASCLASSPPELLKTQCFQFLVWSSQSLLVTAELVCGTTVHNKPPLHSHMSHISRARHGVSAPRPPMSQQSCQSPIVGLGQGKWKRCFFSDWIDRQNALILLLPFVSHPLCGVCFGKPLKHGESCLSWLVHFNFIES